MVLSSRSVLLPLLILRILEGKGRSHLRIIHQCDVGRIEMAGGGRRGSARLKSCPDSTVSQVKGCSEGVFIGIAGCVMTSGKGGIIVL